MINLYGGTDNYSFYTLIVYECGYIEANKEFLGFNYKKTLNFLRVSAICLLRLKRVS